MTTDDTDNDLYGVSPGVIAAIMGFFTLLTPYAVVPGWWLIGTTFVYPEASIAYSLLWAFSLQSTNIGLHNFVTYNPALLWTTLPLSLPNVIFAMKVVRYYQNRASKDSVLRWALFALIIPMSILCIQLLWIVEILYRTTAYIYYGPIPVQIAIGLFIVYLIRAPELVTPWTDPERDESWWIEEEIEESCVGKLFVTMEELDEIFKIWD
jgi:hypothetical protein